MVRGRWPLLIVLLIPALFSFSALAQWPSDFSISLSFDSAGAREGAIEVGFKLGLLELSSRTAFGPGGFSLESIGLNLKDGLLDLDLTGDFTLAGFTAGGLAVRLDKGLEGSAEFDLIRGLKSGRLALNFNFSASDLLKLQVQGELAFAPLPEGPTELAVAAKARYRPWLSGLRLELVSTTAFDLEGFSQQDFEVGLPVGPLALTSTTVFNRPQGFSEERLSLTAGVQEARLLLLATNATLSGTLALGPAGYLGATLEAELEAHDPLFRRFYLNGLLEFDPAGPGSALLIADYSSDGSSLSGSGTWERSGLSSGELSLYGIVEQTELELGGALLFGPEGLFSTELRAGFPLGTVYLSSATTIERGGLWREELVARALLQP
ncbi:MAG: hypothetical protein ACUVQU_07405 [Candidatus Bipolaricaulia bacterium]